MCLPAKPPHPSAVQKDPALLRDVDERVVLDKETNQWLFADEKDGNSVEYHFNYIVEKWLPVSKHLLEEEEENRQEIRRLKKQKLQELRDRISSHKKAKNTGIFVANLPETTASDLADLFSKYGALAQDAAGPRVKLYYENGRFKHEALVVYQNDKSVELAIQMMDGFKLKGAAIAVEPATFETDSDKLAEIKARLWARIVVLENMYRQEELSDELKEDVELDIREECEKLDLHDVGSVQFHSKRPVVTVKFKTADAAARCIAKFGGRYYDGLTIAAKVYSGEKLT